MKLPKNVKVKKSWLGFIPIVARQTGSSLYPNIYLSQEIYFDLKKEKPSHKSIGVLIHEQTHIKRQREIGWFLWGIKYLFSPKFRFNEEFIAMKEQMKYYKKYNLEFMTTRRAKNLSSYLYFWCISYKKAKKKLEEAWNNT